MAVEQDIDGGEKSFEAGFAHPCFVGNHTGGEEVEMDGTAPGGEPDGYGRKHAVN